MPNNLTIAFARRGYSASGGAEAYLQRLGRGLVDRGHRVQLIATEDWPQEAWPLGEIIRLPGRSSTAFADELEKRRGQLRCDLLMSLERVWRCDLYRAGDGVHRVWLERRRQFATPWQNFLRRFNRKHDGVLRLEKSLFSEGGAKRIIANSQMVKKQIVDLYGYPAEKIEIVRNGVPLERFRFDPARREQARAELQLRRDEIAVLFAGSGWERKGLRFALEAVARCDDLDIRFLVAGRGSTKAPESARVRFLGEVADLAPVYAASDIFLLPTIYDPFSNACLEAFASGLPVITTRANGFSEIMDDRVHGSVIDSPGDVEGLCAALRYWSDEVRRASARSAIVARSAQFDISENLAQTLRILAQMSASAAST